MITDVNDDLNELLQCLADVEASGGTATYYYRGVSSDGDNVIGARRILATVGDIPTATDREFFSMVYRAVFGDGATRSAEHEKRFCLPYKDLMAILELPPPLTKEMCDDLSSRLARCSVTVENTEIINGRSVISESANILGNIESRVSVKEDWVSGTLSSTWLWSMPSLARFERGTINDLKITAAQARILQRRD